MPVEFEPCDENYEAPELHGVVPRPAIALLPWGVMWDDFLDTIDLPLEQWCREGPGGWMLGHVDIFAECGLRTVLVFFSARVRSTMRYRHHNTGTTIVVIPARRGWATLRRHLDVFERRLAPKDRLRRKAVSTMRYLLEYASTRVLALTRELRRSNCQAVVCQEYEFFRFDICVALGALLRLPVFATYQGGTFDRNRVGRAIRPLTIRGAAGLFIAPRAEIERVRSRYKLPEDRLLQVFNPVNLDMWANVGRAESRAALEIPAAARVVVWHGRVEMKVKGLDVLLDAWQQICKERAHQELRLVLLGTGNDAGKLQHRLDTENVPNVHWTNKYVTDLAIIRRVLSAADVYAFPSRREGFPVAPIEAMASGLPVIAADASGVADIFIDGEESGGIVVPRGDVAAFAVALGRLLDDEPLARAMGQRARDRVESSCSVEAAGSQMRAFLSLRGVSVAPPASHSLLSEGQ